MATRLPFPSATGTYQVLVVPVLESGQAFCDPSLANLATALRSRLFDEVTAFFRENSFGSPSGSDAFAATLLPIRYRLPRARPHPGRRGGHPSGWKGGAHQLAPHLAGYHKRHLRWIPATRIHRVPMPVPTGQTDRECWLVPVEHWDANMEAEVRSAVGGVIPICQLMEITLPGAAPGSCWSRPGRRGHATAIISPSTLAAQLRCWSATASLAPIRSATSSTSNTAGTSTR